MSDYDRIWREGDPLWTWADEESVPRYKWAQISQKEIVKHLNRIAELQKRIHEAQEIYAGMEGFMPETAHESYCLRIIEQMNKALQETNRE